MWATAPPWDDRGVETPPTEEGTMYRKVLVPLAVAATAMLAAAAASAATLTPVR
jgi:hypothetical protein